VIFHLPRALERVAHFFAAEDVAGER